MARAELKIAEHDGHADEQEPVCEEAMVVDADSSHIRSMRDKAEPSRTATDLEAADRL